MNRDLKESPHLNYYSGKFNQSFFKTFKSKQNTFLNLLNPKNSKVLPRIQRSNFTELPPRYIQTPKSQAYQQRLKLFQSQGKEENTIFKRPEKKCLFEINSLERQSCQLNKTSPIQTNHNLLENKIENKHFAVNRRGKRPYNEDRFVCKNGVKRNYFKSQVITKEKNDEVIDFYSVFDGHGGTACAEFLKDNLLNIFLRSKHIQTNIEQALRQAYKTAEEKFISICESKKSGLETSGACALSCIISQNKITVASVGDCRAIMFNREYLCQMTKDHKPTDTSQKMRILKCGGKIYKEQARFNRFNNFNVKQFSCVRILPGSLNVSRTIGDIEAKVKKYGGLPGMISPEPEIKTFEKQNYEVMVIGSDGLYEAFSNKEIQQLYYKVLNYEQRKVIPASEMGQKFIDELIEQAQKKSTDNITIIVVMLGSNQSQKNIQITKKYEINKIKNNE